VASVTAGFYAAVRDAGSVTDRRSTAIRVDLTDRASIDDAARAAADVTSLINAVTDAGRHMERKLREEGVRS
jgi:hypothetical protein